MKRMRLFMLSFVTFFFAMILVLTVQLINIKSIANNLGIGEKADAFQNIFLGNQAPFLLLVVIVFSLIQFILFLIMVVTRDKDFSVSFLDKLNALGTERDADATYDQALDVYKSIITDPETGAVIYKYFQTILDKEFIRSSRYKIAFSVMRIAVLDKQNFEAHHKHASSNIHSVLRNVDVVSVNAQKEFVCLLPNTRKANANLASGRIFKRLQTVRELTGEKITLAVGISTFPDDGENLETLLISLERNFQKALMLGEDKVVF
jgi:GGDEF domain-containing protein